MLAIYAQQCGLAIVHHYRHTYLCAPTPITVASKYDPYRTPFLREFVEDMTRANMPKVNVATHATIADATDPSESSNSSTVSPPSVPTTAPRPRRRRTRAERDAVMDDDSEPSLPQVPVPRVPQAPAANTDASTNSRAFWMDQVQQFRAAPPTRHDRDVAHFFRELRHMFSHRAQCPHAILHQPRHPDTPTHRLCAVQLYRTCVAFAMPELRQTARDVYHLRTVRESRMSFIATLYCDARIYAMVSRIQSLARGYLVRANFVRMRGPAWRNRAMCANDSDFSTLEPLKDIPDHLFVSWPANEDETVTYGFNLNSLCAWFRKSHTWTNPYTRDDITMSMVAINYVYAINLRLRRPMDDDVHFIITEWRLIIQHHLNHLIPPYYHSMVPRWLNPSAANHYAGVERYTLTSAAHTRLELALRAVLTDKARGVINALQLNNPPSYMRQDANVRITHKLILIHALQAAMEEDDSIVDESVPALDGDGDSDSDTSVTTDDDESPPARPPAMTQASVVEMYRRAHAPRPPTMARFSPEDLNRMLLNVPGNLYELATWARTSTPNHDFLSYYVRLHDQLVHHFWNEVVRIFRHNPASPIPTTAHWKIIFMDLNLIQLANVHTTIVYMFTHQFPMTPMQLNQLYPTERAHGVSMLDSNEVFCREATVWMASRRDNALYIAVLRARLMITVCLVCTCADSDFMRSAGISRVLAAFHAAIPACASLLPGFDPNIFRTVGIFAPPTAMPR